MTTSTTELNTGICILVSNACPQSCRRGMASNFIRSTLPYQDTINIFEKYFLPTLHFCYCICVWSHTLYATAGHKNVDTWQNLELCANTLARLYYIWSLLFTSSNIWVTIINTWSQLSIPGHIIGPLATLLNTFLYSGRMKYCYLLVVKSGHSWQHLVSLGNIWSHYLCLVTKFDPWEHFETSSCT